MGIYNLTQHIASKGQLADGVVEPSAVAKAEVRRLLTLESPADIATVGDRACALAALCPAGCKAAMVGGHPVLVNVLAAALVARGIRPMMSFTARVSEDQPDGTKVTRFSHVGWLYGNVERLYGEGGALYATNIAWGDEALPDASEMAY